MRTFTALFIVGLLPLAAAGCLDPVCGDGLCERSGGENEGNCPLDCGDPGPACGDGICQAGEHSFSCPTDCPPDDPDPNPGPGPGPIYCGDRPINPGKTTVPMSGFYQECDSWCWAASAQAVARLYGQAFRQCDLVTAFIFGPNAGAYGKSCCTAYGCSQCYRYAHVSEISHLLSTLGLYHRAFSGSLNELTIQTEISNGRPVYIFIQFASGGHFALIVGYEPGPYGGYVYSVADPTTGHVKGDYYTLTRNYDGRGGTITGSWYRLSTRPDGCNPGFDPKCGCD